MIRKWRRVHRWVKRRLWMPFINIRWYIWLIIPTITAGTILILPINDLTTIITLILLFLGSLSLLCLTARLIIRWQMKAIKAIIIVAILGFVGYEIVELSHLSNSLSHRISKIEQRFGNQSKLECNPADLPEKLKPSVVRIIGNNMEGTGFFIDSHRIITNFHVIDEEPSPKVVYDDNSFEKPTHIIGDKSLDLAVLTVNTQRPALESLVVSDDALIFGEPVYSVGYPRGSDIPGPPLLSMGTYAGTRETYATHVPELVLTNASLIQGMSGGPLVDACGKAIAINTMGEPGIGFYINLIQALANSINFSDSEVATLKVDPLTPEGAVKTFYDLINASRWQEAYGLLTPQRRQQSTFEDWVYGYNKTLHVDVIKSEFKDGKVLVKLYARDWINGDINEKFFEGEWTVVFAGDVWNLASSNIKQVDEPEGYAWWYE